MPDDASQPLPAPPPLPPHVTPRPVILLYSPEDEPLRPRLVTCVKVAWIADALYVGVHLLFLMHPLYAFFYLLDAGQSLEQLGRRPGLASLAQCLLWIEPLLRLTFLSMCVRAFLRVRAGRPIPRVDLWAYVVFRLALTATVVAVARPSPSAMPFLDHPGLLEILRRAPQVTLPTPAQSIPWILLDVASPLTVAAALLSMRGTRPFPPAGADRNA